MNEEAPKPAFLRACARAPVPTTPVWLMRQAGRCLPSYRKIREQYGFLEVIRQPELISKVTLTPFEYLDVDAAIMFADIMLPLDALGIPFDIVESVGPVVENPIRSLENVERFMRRPVVDAIPAVFEAIKIVRKELPADVPLIGFSGAPFTLASYLVEGKATRDFALTKQMMQSDPTTWHALMSALTDLIIEYLVEQADAGVDAIQLFDSWVGALSPLTFRSQVQPYSDRIFSALAPSGLPRIHFGTSTAGFLEDMACVDCEVVGVDWRIDLDAAWQRIGPNRAIQGNLDPAVLLGPPEVVVSAAREVLRRAGGRAGHIFNLGHGVLPDTPLDNLKLLIDVVHSYEP